MSSKRKKIQYVFLDFDGAETFYAGDLLHIDQITVADSGFSAEKVAMIAAALNEKYANQIIFVTEKPAVEEFSTVYIGKSDDFKQYGNFAGLAESIDKGNSNMSDNAFVMLDADAAIETVIEIISHEIGHIVYGSEHAKQTGSLADFAANYSTTPVVRTIGGIDADAYEEWAEGDWENLPSGAYFSSITGSTGNDTITFAANRGRVIDGDIDLGPGNDKIIMLASTTESEVTVEDIYMGSGNDSIEIYNEAELDGTYEYGSDGSSIDMGDGDDKILLNGGQIEDVTLIDMGNGNNTIQLINDADLETTRINFGSGNDTFTITSAYAPCTEEQLSIGGYFYSDDAPGIFFGAGADRMTVSTNARINVTGTLDFGAGNDTFVLDGGMRIYSNGQIRIVGLENLSGSGWVSLTGQNIAMGISDFERFQSAGITIYESFGSSCFNGQAELSDNTRATALDETDDSDIELDFWLCGSTKAAATRYALADSVDWIKFTKCGETEISWSLYNNNVDPAYNLNDSGFAAKLRDANGTYLCTLEPDNDNDDYYYGMNYCDISSRPDGIYYLELSVTNDSYATGWMDIETEEPPAADLCIENYTVSADAISKTGSVKLNFKLSNRGGVNAGASKLKIYDGNTLIRTLDAGAVAAFNSRDCSVTLNGSQLGTGNRNIYVVADANNQVTESNENNNNAFKTVNVVNGSMDLCIQDYTVSASSIDYSGSVKLNFKLANKGTGTAAASVLKVYDGNTLLRTFNMGSVAAGSYRNASFTLKGSEIGSGSSKIYIVADADSRIAESNETNNKAYRTINVTAADLCIKDYTVTAASIGYSGSVKVSFKLKNNGNGTAGASVLKVYDGNTLLRTFNMGSVAAGSYRNASFTLKGSELGTGSSKVYLVVDANNQVTESNEANNKAYRTINVTSSDLCIKDYNVSATSISKSGSVKLTFKYANNGNAASGSSVLKVYDGNTLLREFTMGSVAAGSFRNASVTLQGSELGNGARKLYLVVDADNQVAESNEANNKAYRTVNVTSVQSAEAPETEWLAAGFDDYNNDGFEDMLVTDSSNALSADLDLTNSAISDLADALGSSWEFNKVADWNNDGKLEIMFCGSKDSLAPATDADRKLLITLA